MRPLRCLLLLLLVLPSIGFAQKKIPLEVTHIGEDSAGRMLVTALREVIRTTAGQLVPPEGKQSTLESYGMRLTGELARPRIKLQLITTDVEPGSRTAISVNVIYDSPDMPLGGAYIRGMVETCGRDEAAGCAKRIFLKTNTSIDWLRENWPSLWKTL